MKLIKYTLTPEGTIPDYVVDGGYLPVKNNNTWPQDLDLVGVALDSATEESFASEATLLAYCQSNNFGDSINPITEEVIPLTTVVSHIWSKLG